MKHLRSLWSFLMVVLMALSVAHVSPLKVTYAQDDLIRMLREMRHAQMLESRQLDGLPMRLPPKHETVSVADEVNQPQMLEGALGVAENSLMVYQSFRDGNWEIYIADGNNANQRRLTNNAASDIRPKLTMNGTKIAFASNRTGNYEIFTMNTDGSDVRQITNNPATDSAPVWSPDRTQIAFVSTRDGGADIFVMNADGTDVKKLTYNADDDLYPAWSPDGSRIAYVTQNEDGYGTLVVVNVDGSNQKVIRTALAYPELPSWSLIGNRIAFDYDADGDYLQELEVIQIVEIFGSNDNFLLNFGDAKSIDDLYEPWVGAWGPDGIPVTYTRAEYGVQDNKVYLKNTFFEGLSLPSKERWRFPNNSGRDMNLDWKWFDAQPPTLTYQFETDVAQPNSYPNGIKINWILYDIGPSGGSPYFFEYQCYGKDNTWHASIPADRFSTSFNCDGNTIGHSVPASLVGVDKFIYSGAEFPADIYIRARASDRARNNSSWVETKVHFSGYPFKIMVSDNRTYPVYGVSVSTTLQTVEPILTDANGYSSVDIKSPYVEYQEYFYQTRKTGYGAIPLTSRYFSSGSSSTHLATLYPADNIIINSGFENGLGSWNKTSTLVSLQNNFGVTGKSHVALLQLTASPEIPTSVEEQSFSQTVNLANLYKPTLSFWTSARESTQENYAIVHIRSSTQEKLYTFLQKPTFSFEMFKNWMDMSEWSDQQITITFSGRFHGNYSQYQPHNMLFDDITIGSWLTPIISDITPSAVSAKSISTTLTISGENFIFDKVLPEVYVGGKQLYSVEMLNENTLIASLPDNFPAGIYDVRVVNPGGQDAVLPNALRVGNAEYLPIVRKR